MTTKKKRAAKTSKHFDVVIIGGGLSGLSLACLLGPSGLRVACIDQQDPATLSAADERTTAISAGSQKILEKAGLWQDLQSKACAIRDIQIRDGSASPVLLGFLSREVDGRAFGWIVENRDLRAALMQRVKTFKNISHIAPAKLQEIINSDHETSVSVTLENGDMLTASLVVGADGRGSAVRSAMGVTTRAWSYDQRATVCTVWHEHSHEHRAVEHFWPQGPFAILPMNDDPAKKAPFKHRSAVVFTEHGPDSKSLMHFTDAQFETALAARFPDSYGAVHLATQRASYPLSLVHATSYIAPRMALIADAAHGIHPIAGQGLNLGFRDVEALSRLVIAAFEAGRDIGDPSILQEYERQRRADNVAMIAFTDTLVRLFSNDIMPVRALRKAGLRAVSKWPAAKRFFMRKAMGEG
jgi:2-octaprenyl-6-methoxyphenol hydroxylase